MKGSMSHGPNRVNAEMLRVEDYGFFPPALGWADAGLSY